MRSIKLFLTIGAVILSSAILAGCVCAADDVYCAHVSRGYYPIYSGYCGGYYRDDYCGPRGYYRERSCVHAHVIPQDDCYSGHSSRRHGGYGPEAHVSDGYSGGTSSAYQGGISSAYQGGTSSTYQGGTYNSGSSNSYAGSTQE